MNLLTKLKTAVFSAPIDERQEMVKQSASWKAFIVLVIAYLGMGIYFDLNNQIMPISTQIIFFLAFGTYVYQSFKNDGYSFLIPFVPESRGTLDMPKGARFVGWATFWISVITVFISAVRGPVELVSANFFSWPWAVLVSVILLIVSFLFHWYIAMRIRLGSKFWIYLNIIMVYLSILTILLIAFATVADKLLPPVTPEPIVTNEQGFDSAYSELDANNGSFSDYFNYIYAFIIAYFITKYYKVMISEGEELQKKIEDKKLISQRIINFVIALLGLAILVYSANIAMVSLIDNTATIINYAGIIVGGAMMLGAAIREFINTGKAIVSYKEKTATTG